MKVCFAVVADIHITDTPATPKNQVLEWCIQEIRSLAPSGILLLGDMTATGRDSQAKTVLDAFHSIGIPVYSTPGNAEYRSMEGACPQAFTIEAPAPVLLVNSANYDLSQEDCARIAGLPAGANVLLGTHVPVVEWSRAAKEAVEAARERHAIGAVIAGHVHQDGPETMRGLDPDKASGGVPAFELWELQEGGTWKRTRREMPGIAPAEWPDSERQRFISHLGISCMYESLQNLKTAAELGIQALELRYPAVPLEEQGALREAVAVWRAQAAGQLSMHLPGLLPLPELPKLADGVASARKLGCNRVTLHVPSVTKMAFPKEKEKLLENFKRYLSPLLEAGIVIGIENLHTRPPKELSDDTRNFGCTIRECMEWILELREKLQSERIGFHLDIGHARNNVPFSSEENLSDYYTRMGALVNGMHLHQVRQAPDGSMCNHTPLKEFYGKLISLSSLFLIFRQKGIPEDTPMYLEIRENAGVECWKAFREQIVLP